MDSTAPEFYENRTFDEIAIGDSAEIVRVLGERDLHLFAAVSGDIDPAGDGPLSGRQPGPMVADGMWGGALIAAVLGTRLPGPGMVHLGQTLRFLQPVAPGDRLSVRVTVTAREAAGQRVTLACEVRNQSGAPVIDGVAEVRAPRQKMRVAAAAAPDVRLHRAGQRFGALVARAADLPPLPTAVIHPCDALSIAGAERARAAGLIVPLWVGPRERILAAAGAAGVALDAAAIVDAPHSHAAAEAAVALVRGGHAGALMKGKLHTDEVMEAVLDRACGLRTERRISHVFALDTPGLERLLFITDAAINIAPNLGTLRDIVQNALDLVLALGVRVPRVALLSAVETVSDRLPSTLLAAAICKMHDRGQITGGLVDGPLAFDNAISPAAVAAKGIVSAVAGRADILVAPNLEAGNMIAKQLIHLGGAEVAGIALGARVPIVLTSRADSAEARLASAALARLHAAQAAPV